MDKDSKSGSSAKNTSESSTSTVIAEQSVDTSSKVASKDAQSERKAKPPPLDVTAAQELQQQAMAGPKTPTSASPVTPGVMPDHRKVKKRKIGHRRVNEEGQITFKKIETSQIMGSIQLGISCSISALASKPERDLLIQDFSLVETKTFPKNGSNFTPAHRYNEFTFKTYSPVAFRYFRHLFGIEPVDFLLSLCNNPLIELTNPGASGSIFYLTEDDEFIIKTVQHKEAEFLTKLLPGYYMNLNQNPRTLLPKFYGLFCYQCIGKNVRLIVMNNLLPSFITLHEKYDLKGSTYKRKASKNEKKKSSPTYKDLDFIERHPDGIFMEAETYHALIRTITRDCRVLESFKIMDYSLLVGVHNVDLAKREKKERRQKREADGKVSDESDSASPYQVPPEKADASLVRSKSINKPRLANYSTAMESIQAEAELLDEDEDMPPGGIPAKNAKGDNLLLFIGIIDILQSYHLKKKLEHTFKSMLHDGDTVSVHRPGFYAQRFLQFMSNTVFKKMSSALKHVPSKRKATSSKKVPASGNCDLSQLSRNLSVSESPPDIAVALPAAETGSSSVVGDFKGSSSPCSSRERQPSGGDVDPVPPRVLSLRSSTVSVQKTSVSGDKMELVRSNLSQIAVHSESVGDGVSEVVSSVASSVGSFVHAYTPSYSIEGSTPTYTEGTPSFTESGLSGDTACPTTPVKIVKKSMDSLLSPVESQL